MKKTAILLFLTFITMTACAKSEHLQMIVDTQRQGVEIPSDYIGLSYETRMILPQAGGSYYFTPSNRKLVTLFKTLGIKSLRLGGNSVDHPGSPAPVVRDIDELFAFARAAGVKIIYTVRLQDGTANEAAHIAKHIYDHYSDLLAYFAIGNEPGYYKNYEQALQPRWDSLMRAMRDVAPSAHFCAPDDNPNPVLCTKLLRDYSYRHGGPISLITIHSYPAGCAYKNPGNPNGIKGLIPFDYQERCDKLLSDSLPKEYDRIYSKMSPVINHFPYRLSETNNYWYSGLDGASNAYASALWALDYLYWWASHFSLGINFHTGDKVGGTDMPAHYAAFFTEGDSMHIRPLSYAIKAFTLASHGSLVPVTFSPSPQINAYAVRSGQDDVAVTIINKQHGPQAKPRTIDLTLSDESRPVHSAHYLLLQTPDGNILRKEGVTLAGTHISGQGEWSSPQWKKAKIRAHHIQLIIPPASAIILKIKIFSSK